MWLFPKHLLRRMMTGQVGQGDDIFEVCSMNV